MRVTTPVMRPFTVFGFATTHDALSAEAVLAEAQVTAIVIPAPKALGTLCGLALRVPSDEASCAAEALGTAGIVCTGELAMLDR